MPDIGIVKLGLQTRDIGTLRPFYVDRLGLAVTREDRGSITFQAGGTDFTFVESAQGDPIYHFAFNIPENKLDAAIEWLRPRAPIHREPDGSEIFDFQSWNAHAVYFFDPAGNILEFIARHNLNNAAPGAFTTADILYASEIGIVVDDVGEAVKAARRDWGFHVFGGSQSDDFAAVGTDEHLLIFSKRGRPWFGGECRQAGIFGMTAAFTGERNKLLVIAKMPYSLKMLDSESIGPNAV